MPEPAGVLTVAAEGVAGVGLAWAAGGAAGAGLVVAVPDESDFGAAVAGAAAWVDFRLRLGCGRGASPVPHWPVQRLPARR